MTDSLTDELARVTAELEAVRTARRAACAERAAELRAARAEVDALLDVRNHKLAELEARLRSLYVRNAELRRALLKLE